MVLREDNVTNDAHTAKLNISIIGPPSSGKTTQAAKVSEQFCLCHLTSSMLLQSRGKKRTAAGDDAKEIIEQGGMVTAEVMANLVGHAIDENADCANGFVLDGIPRNLAEARDLQRMLNARQENMDAVIELSVDERLLRSRVAGRLTHLSSGRPYHQAFRPPKEYMKDDDTGEHLVRRPEDRPENLSNQLSAFHAGKTPVIDYYKKLGTWTNVDGGQEPSEVWRELSMTLNDLLKHKRT